MDVLLFACTQASQSGETTSPRLQRLVMPCLLCKYSAMVITNRS